jgi:PRTRC genetic system protein E
MFTELSKGMVEGDSYVILVVMGKGGEMCVTTTPKGTFTHESLSTPLSMVGTPEELDEGMVTEMHQYVGARKSLKDQVEAAALVLKNASAAVAADTANKLSAKPNAGGKPLAPAKFVAAATDDDEADGDDDAEGDARVSEQGASGASKVPATAPAEVSLF